MRREESLYLSIAASYFIYLSISLLIQTKDPKYLSFAVRDFAVCINRSASTTSGLLSWSRQADPRLLWQLGEEAARLGHAHGQWPHCQ